MKLFSKNPDHKANLSYTGFDMSHDKKFTSSVGQLLPVFYDFLITGDKVKISEDMFTRTQTLMTSAFVDIKEHIEYYFVPMTLIFSLYPQFKFSVGVPKSNMFDSESLHKTFPFMDIVHLYQSMILGNTPASLNLGGQYPYTYSFPNGCSGQQYSFEKNNFHGRHRIANMLDYGHFPYREPGVSLFDQYNVPINLFAACAYQKIYYDFYNIDSRQQVQNLAFNLDAWYSEFVGRTSGDSSPHAQDFEYATCLMLEQRYVPWKKDYFTGMIVSPLENISSQNTNFFGTNLQQITDFISDQTPVAISDNVSSHVQTDFNTTQVGTSLRGTSSPSSNNIANVLSTGYIRKMFALEKLLSITRRSQDDYASLTLAHYGTEMSPVYSDKSMFLGAVGQQITINDVVATMNNNDTVLGDIAGKGIGSKRSTGKDTVQFTAPCDGVIMGIYYARPEIDYKATGTSRLNTWTMPTELYTPEYANLGPQPVFAYELNNDYLFDDSISPLTPIGWNWRYSQNKSKINKVYTGFILDSLSDWTIGKYVDGLSFGANTQDYYVSPNSLDPMMVEKYKGGQVSVADWNFSFDPLLHWFHFNYYKVSVMDKYGLPKL